MVQADRVLIVIKWALCSLIESDLAFVKELDSNEEIMIRVAQKQLALHASELGKSESCPLSASELDQITATNGRISTRIGLLRSEADQSGSLRETRCLWMRVRCHSAKD